MENNRTDIEYVRDELIERLDQLAIPDLLRLKIMLYFNKSLDSEEVLDENCLALDKHYVKRLEVKK